MRRTATKEVDDVRGGDIRKLKPVRVRGEFFKYQPGSYSPPEPAGRWLIAINELDTAGYGVAFEGPLYEWEGALKLGVNSLMRTPSLQIYSIGYMVFVLLTTEVGQGLLLRYLPLLTLPAIYGTPRSYFTVRLVLRDMPSLSGHALCEASGFSPYAGLLLWEYALSTYGTPSVSVLTASPGDPVVAVRPAILRLESRRLRTLTELLQEFPSRETLPGAPRKIAGGEKSKAGGLSLVARGVGTVVPGNRLRAYRIYRGSLEDRLLRGPAESDEVIGTGGLVETAPADSLATVAMSVPSVQGSVSVVFSTGADAMAFWLSIFGDAVRNIATATRVNEGALYAVLLSYLAKNGALRLEFSTASLLMTMPHKPTGLATERAQLKPSHYAKQRINSPDSEYAVLLWPEETSMLQLATVLTSEEEEEVEER